MRSGSAAETKASLDKVKAERKKIMDGNSYGDVFGTAAAIFTGSKAPPELRAQRSAELANAEADLALRLQQRIKLEERVAKANGDNAKAIEATTKATRGVRKPANPLPGSEKSPHG